MLRHPGSLIPDSSCLLLNGMRWEGRTARLFLTRQNSSGLCLHLLSERIIPATAWRTQLFRISPSLDKPEANIKFLFAREEKHQDLPEHKPGKPRSPLKPSLKLSGWWHRSSQAAQRGGTDALQAIWCFYLSKPHDVCTPQNVFRQQIQGKEIELHKNTVLVNKLFQKYAVDGPKNVRVKVHTGNTSFFQRTILTVANLWGLSAVFKTACRI